MESDLDPLGAIERKLMKPVLFLQDAIAELKGWVRDRYKELRGDLDALRDSEEKTSKDLESLRKENHQLGLQYRGSLARLDETASKELLQERDDYFYRTFRVAMDRSDAKADDLKLGCEKHGEMLSQVDLQMNALNALFAGLREESQRVRDALKVLEENSAAVRHKSLCDENMRRKDAEVHFQITDRRGMELAAEMDRLTERADKAEKRLKVDADRLSNDLRSESLKALDQFRDDLDLQKKQSGLLKEDLSAIRAGRSGKEVEDFMKQVGYNAKQIAKLHEKLEGK